MSFSQKIIWPESSEKGGQNWLLKRRVFFNSQFASKTEWLEIETHDRILYLRFLGLIVCASQIIKLGITNTKYLPLRQSNKWLNVVISSYNLLKQKKMIKLLTSFQCPSSLTVLVFIGSFHVADKCGVFFGCALRSQDS